MTNGTSCEDCVTCKECGGLVLCLSEPRPHWPCPHFEPICGDCWPNGCTTCERNAELAERVAASEPHDLDTEAATKAAAAYAERMAQWRKDSGYDATTNSSRRQA